ncbi:hypothetical protein JCM17844_02410 [Iodidimonas gelatinilytica]|uniref:Uncharacterized protein n=1 Tax=Iodidimonas gelatinilytica TaxID=1236966 RepID=A0A5A7MLN8_9PROT|nr:hypothetical protein [Iodidimonas gelatinilytica]GEQ96604.1 hypothetical protein JCM17844_02410 [Iodidimonas gelatinilytica]GER00077.1 hypothetical protein JCM17845_07000 [Iodidimonas gelatinilytica]
MIRRLWPRMVPALSLAVLALILLLLALRSPSSGGDSDHVAVDKNDMPETRDIMGGGASFAVVVDAAPIVEQNMFSTTRTPPPMRASSRSSDEAESAELSLTGVVMAKGREAAILRDNATTRMVSLRLGKSYRGWELVSLSSFEATLSKGGDRMTLKLKFAPDAAGMITDSHHLGMPAHLVKPRAVIAPRHGDANGNPVPASRQSIDNDRLSRRGSRT